MKLEGITGHDVDKVSELAVDVEDSFNARLIEILYTSRTFMGRGMYYSRKWNMTLSSILMLVTVGVKIGIALAESRNEVPHESVH